MQASCLRFSLDQIGANVVIERMSLLVAGDWLKDEIQLIANRGSGLFFTVTGLHILEQPMALTAREN